MAKAVIPEGKKRYSVLLTEENFVWFQTFVTNVCNLPRSHVSVMLDDMILSVRNSVQPILDRYEREGKKPSAADFLVLIGTQLQSIGSEEIDLIK